jgi:hypothetical protein
MPTHFSSRHRVVVLLFSTGVGLAACDSAPTPDAPTDARVVALDAGGAAPDVPAMPLDGWVAMPDAAWLPTPDAARVPSPDAELLDPDAAWLPTPDAAWVPTDAAWVPPDAAWVPADAAWGPADAAMPTPDAAWLPTPDAAWVPTPDAAWLPTPDAARVPSPDAAWLPTPDAAWFEPDAVAPTLDLSVPDPDAAAPPSWERPLRASDLPPAQLNVGADTWRAWLFADMIRGASLWVKSARNAPPLEPAAADALGAELRFDARGWPTNLPATAELEVQTGYSTGEAFDPETNALRPSYLHGVFVLTWAGRGTVDFLNSRNNGQGYRILRREPGRIVLRMDSAARHPVLRIADVDPADPVRDVHLWAPAADGAGLELTEASELSSGRVAGSLEPAPEAAPPLFHPVFLAHLAEAPDAGVLRFLTWQNINALEGQPALTPEDLPDADAAFREVVVMDRAYGRHAAPAARGRLGYPYERSIDLCNATGRDCWLQIPHTATPEVYRALARIAAARLRPDLRLWVEYSNEIWNAVGPYLPQRDQARAVAAAHFAVAPEAVTFAQLAWGAGAVQAECLRVVEDEWRALGQADERLINVAAAFAAGPDYNRRVVEAMREVDPALPEVLAISNYFGHDTQGAIYALHAWGAEPGVWPASLYDATAAVVRRALHRDFPTWQQNGEIARAAGLPLVSYEGGQHMLPTGYGDWNDPESVDFMYFMYDFQRSRRMGELYREHYALYAAAGGRAPSQWWDVGTYSFFGYWGAKEYVWQTPEETPKWAAFAEWGALNGGVRAPHDPQGTRPALEPASLRAEAGQAFEVVLQARGGDGPVTLALLGGALPDEVVLLDEGAGLGRLLGVPADAGTFRFVVRALDADGDPDDRRYELTVDPEGVSESSLVVFRGAELPASLQADGRPNGRYDPVVRPVSLDGGARICEPMTRGDGAAPLFDREFNGGSNRIEPTSSLNAFGGWCLTALDGDTRVGSPDMNTWVGLREGAFKAWMGDLTGPAAFDLVLLWQASQFGARPDADGRFAFGPNAPTSTLQIDLTAIVGDGTNELRFVVQNGDRLFVSEAAFTERFLGDGVFRLERFSGNGEPGRRWAEIAPPENNDMAMPDADRLDFAAMTFDDVRAVGVFYRGTRWRWNFAFDFVRFFALGRGG